MKEFKAKLLPMILSWAGALGTVVGHITQSVLVMFLAGMTLGAAVHLAYAEGQKNSVKPTEEDKYE